MENTSKISSEGEVQKERTSEQSKQEEKQESNEQSLKEQLAKAQEEAKETVDHLKRLQAEYENYIKRSGREVEQRITHAQDLLLLDVLDIYEDFQRSLQGQVKEREQELREGLEMIRKKFAKFFEAQNIKPMEALGKVCNYNYHDVLLTTPTNEAEADVILEVLQQGYIRNDRVIRHAKVRVAKPLVSKSSSEKEDEKKGAGK